MPFKFCDFCELLDTLAQNKHHPGKICSKPDKADHIIVKEWYDKYDSKIDRNGSAAVAFLSAFFPERRPDRTYNLQDKRLSQIFGRALGLGQSRVRELQSWQRNDGEDFATCVRRVMAVTENLIPEGNEVTLEELDKALTKIAANTIASAPKIRALAEFQTPDIILTPIIRRLKSSEAQWLVKMIRKSYSPVQIPEHAALHRFHFLLPKLLEVQNCFDAVINTLSHPQLSSSGPTTEADQKSLMATVARNMDPVLGTMIRRQPFWKARSIKHCVKMVEKRTMSIERKYDGEYCQVHIDVSQRRAKLQIFSKNGRDSTSDRAAVHDAIKAGLRLDRSDCRIKSRAILEGELLIFSTSENKILPFHHVRKHVRHGGRRIGTEKDSPKKVGENPMIMFYDILLLDDDVLITKPHKKRRAILKGVVTSCPGYAQIVERAMIDFSSSSASGILRTIFGQAIRNRWEGFVLKGLEDPYFDWKEYNRSIKLKKDYIGGLGDSVDLCIVGGRRNPRDEIGFEAGTLTWTSFYVAALINKDGVRRFDERPIFKILGCLGPGSMSKDDILALNSEGKMVEHEYTTESQFIIIQHPRAASIPLPTHIFQPPLVVELLGAGFERPQSADFWILRFPRRAGSKMRVHRDRGITDTVSFDELQAMAQESINNVEEIESQEDALWVERLLAADPKSKYNVNKSQSTSTPKTLHSETTVDITPAHTARSNTQQNPVIVRMDSEELIAEDLFGNYPESCPELRTPSRRSDGTLTSPFNDSPHMSRRYSQIVNGSPSPTISGKRQREQFEEDNRNLDQEPRSTLSNLANPSFSCQQQELSNTSHLNKLTMEDNIIMSPAEREVDAKNTSTTNVADIEISPPRKKQKQKQEQSLTHHQDETSSFTTQPTSLPISESLQYQRQPPEIFSSPSPSPTLENAATITTVAKPSNSTANKTKRKVHTFAASLSTAQPPGIIYTGYLQTASILHLTNTLNTACRLPPLTNTDSAQPQPPHIFLTSSLDFFLTQVIVQSRVSQPDHRIYCAAFFHFSDPHTTVSQLRAIAEQFTVDERLLRDLTLENVSGILVCDADKFRGDGSGDLKYEIGEYAEGVMEITRRKGDGGVKVKMFWKIDD